MRKIECENCGRKVTVEADDRESRAPMRYCRRCGEELPPEEEW
jgi:DNA replicative helicase MCM subunit Mcm2 (Cdc46/Mcm family)